MPQRSGPGLPQENASFSSLLVKVVRILATDEIVGNDAAQGRRRSGLCPSHKFQPPHESLNPSNDKVAHLVTHHHSLAQLFFEVPSRLAQDGIPTRCVKSCSGSAPRLRFSVPEGALTGALFLCPTAGSLDSIYVDGSQELPPLFDFSAFGKKGQHVFHTGEWVRALLATALFRSVSRRSALSSSLVPEENSMG